ncbi:hypothetical protein PHMEG_000505 [Phytophthora megakarya]|uniref:Uncharacterized protein n=1 Tax=Phytophthora megakarya TaxID=4795 RepID=A0A225X2U7_9STRA|nr:hypothetical protein PHMEG_000505 [Phytophthora megakarya]
MESAEEPVVDVMDNVEPDTNVEEVLRQPPSESSGLELAPFRSQPEKFQDLLVFHPEPERSRRTREPVILLENGPEDEQDVLSKDSNYPPSPKRARIDEDGLVAEAVMAYVANIVEVPDAWNSYAEAMASSETAELRKAMDAELFTHKLNATWELVPLRTDTRSIGRHWGFAKKRDDNDTRLVSRRATGPGHSVSEKWRLSDLGYVDVPQGVQNENGMVCKLLKTIYDLKQAASAWNKIIHIWEQSMRLSKHGIVYKKQKNGLKVEAFTDADW